MSTPEIERIEIPSTWSKCVISTTVDHTNRAFLRNTTLFSISGCEINIIFARDEMEITRNKTGHNAKIFEQGIRDMERRFPNLQILFF